MHSLSDRPQADIDVGGVLHEEVELQEFNKEDGMYTYDCPCGDVFVITYEDLCNGIDIARCQSCSLYVKVIYDREEYMSESIEQEDKPAYGLNIE